MSEWSREPWAWGWEDVTRDGREYRCATTDKNMIPQYVTEKGMIPLYAAAPAAPADATVERVMELADEYVQCDRRYRSNPEVYGWTYVEEARAALRAEVERIVRDYAKLSALCTSQGIRLMEAEERAEAAEADARRWDYVLRNPFRAIDILMKAVDTSKPALWRQQANAAIDAAMEEK